MRLLIAGAGVLFGCWALRQRRWRMSVRSPGAPISSTSWPTISAMATCGALTRRARSPRLILIGLPQRDAFHGCPLELGGLHAHALRNPDRALRLAIVAQVGRAQRLFKPPDRARPADGARVLAAARLSDRMRRQVAPRHGLAAQGRQSLGQDRHRLGGRLRQAHRQRADAVGFDEYLRHQRLARHAPLRFHRRRSRAGGFRPSRRPGCGKGPPWPTSRRSKSCRPLSARRLR